jgi:mono/diheme cytochrome c family protein
MRRKSVSLLVFFLGWATTASALEPSVGYPNTDTERLGERLFNQSCRVCHASNVLGTAPGAPALSRETLGGDVAALKEIISSGTAAAGGRMPAWHYRFTPDEIGALALYIKTIPTGADVVPVPRTTAPRGPAAQE